MPIISDPSLILYSCISRGTTILGELNGDQNRDLSFLGRKCIDLAPPYHSVFSHTIRQRRFTFLIDDPFVYFAVFHDTLAKSEGLRFLNGVKLGFCELIEAGSIANFDHFGLQTQFDFLLHGLLSDSESVTLPRMVLSEDSRNLSLDSSNGVVSTPLLTKKKRSNREPGNEYGNLENKEGSCTNFPKNIPFFNDPQKAKQVWKKHVWVVLSVDVFICLVLFVVWLRLCGGFRCVDR